MQSKDQNEENHGGYSEIERHEEPIRKISENIVKLFQTKYIKMVYFELD